MWAALAIVENVAVISVSILSGYTLTLIFTKRTPRAIWKDCPPLAFLLLISTIPTLFSILVSLEWFLILINAIPESSKNFLTIVWSALTGMIAIWYYDCATIAVFTQRIYVLLFPLKQKKLHTIIILVLSMLVAVTITVAFTVIHCVYHLQIIATFKPGCFSLNCMVQNLTMHQFLWVYIKIFLVLLILLLGTIFTLLLRRHEAKFGSNLNVNKRVNTFTRYIFYLRLVLDIVPYFSDVMLRMTVSRQVITCYRCCFRLNSNWEKPLAPMAS
ncbi:hypothetical protein L596_019742 [Steinernema carpocapsae]|uniref:G-protein coupled receptors family 1 profile domain-containing protein n=1 Tax=Steinernema carpocapsae TaxID=34508 RepID=A0A4U5MRN4_STECR|nr:hypothetical protein L596_019742 [Steinernema carpocapsae]